MLRVQMLSVRLQDVASAKVAIVIHAVLVLVLWPRRGSEIGGWHARFLLHALLGVIQQRKDCRHERGVVVKDVRPKVLAPLAQEPAPRLAHNPVGVLVAKGRDRGRA